MAVETVMSEPLSGQFSLFRRENTGKSARKGFSRSHIGQENPTWTSVWRTNPCSTEQGIQ